MPSDRIDPITPASRGPDPVRPPLLTPLEREAERRRREERRRGRSPDQRRPRPPSDGDGDGDGDERPRLDVRG
jgi:hypothetical protein